MKISSINIKNFKRFKDTNIIDIPITAKMVIIVGPNGSGKSSLFDACYEWYKSHFGFSSGGDENYYKKDKKEGYSPRQNILVKFHDIEEIAPNNKKCMSFRTAYRNDADFTVSTISRLSAPQDDIRFHKFIENDQSVSLNYQRLINNTMLGVYSENNNNKTIKELREELIGRVRSSMKNVFDDLTLNNIGDPFGDGSFYFEKGINKSFHYKNLSGGEKSAFDLLLDLVIKLPYFDDTVFFIDEPDSHMHTNLQSKLIKEMYNLISNKSQLWITTHQLGIICAARDINQNNPGSVVILDFSGYDFDTVCSVKPVNLNKTVWEKLLSITLDNYSSNIAPERIILCEGDFNGIKRNNYDADIYNNIFNAEYPTISFVSGGSCNQLEDEKHQGYLILTNLLKSKIFKLVDRDDRSEKQISELNKKSIIVTKRRHLESYLFDDEIITKLAKSVNLENKISEALKIKTDAINESIIRGNPHDDIKSASGEIYNGLKKLLSLTQRGNDTESFMRDTLAPLITSETQIYKELKQEIILTTP